MRYPVNDYARALADAVGDVKSPHADSAAKRFVALLTRNNDAAHLPVIVREAEKILRRRDGTKSVVVQSARPLNKAQEALVKKLHGPKDAFEMQIVPGLVAGIKVVVDGERAFDGSLKGKLDRMFAG